MSLTHPLPPRPQTTSTTDAQPLTNVQHAFASPSQPQSTSTQNLQPTSNPPTLPSNSTHLSSQSTPTPNNNKNVLCQTCHKVPAKYTCPRCSFKSCSLPCTTNHHSISPLTKQQQVCSGVRDPGDTGGFVPMNEYKYGRFVQDYVFLEEMGRRVSEWGKDIQSKHLAESTSGNAGVNGRRQMRGGGGGLGANHQRYGTRGAKHGKTKREVLQEKLEELDIEMMFLPDGMNRRKVNQSTFDNKSNKGFLTIGFRLHRPGSRKAPSASVLSLAQGSNALKKQAREGDASTDSFTLLSHRNELQTPLKDCLARAFQSKSKKEETPLWIQDLIQIEGVTTTTKEDDANRTDHDRPTTLPPPYQILISGPPMFHKTGINSSTSVKRNFVALDKDATLVDALRTHTFVEFPTLEVVGEKDAEHIMTRKDNLVEEGDEWELFARKRRLYDEEDEESGEDGSSGSSMNSSDEDEQEEEERAQEARRKRRKIDVEAGKNLVNSLMAYGDEESEEDDGDENGNGTAPTAASSSSVQPNGTNAAPKGLGVLQMLDYESDKSSEGEEEGEEEDTKVASNAFLAPVSGWGEDREMVDWGDD